ncbi:MAG: PD-(D/E)XK nuclease family protein [Oscillospiraceae bacterium]|nr:PD-(D/E)XK nuclease family protein [Oscillospiraceae bacterium]
MMLIIMELIAINCTESNCQLNYIWSLPGQGGREYLVRKILSLGEKKERVFWIVPEPYSHAIERQLCQAAGASACLWAEVLSFGRLCDNILTSHGGCSLPTLDQGGRLLTLRLAINETSQYLSSFLRKLSKPEFLSQALYTMEECKCHGITPDLLEKAGQNAQGHAKDCLIGFSLIFRAYDKLCAQSAMDSRDKMLLCAEKLQKSDFYSGCHIFVSCFSSFTPQEQVVLKLLGKQSKKITFLWEGRRNVLDFPELFRTAALLEQDLGKAKQEIFDIPKPETEIEFWRAGCSAEECRFIAERIVQLVKNDGYRFRDISVLCANEECFTPLITSIFPHYGIPVFYDKMEPLSNKPLPRLIRAIAACLRQGFRQNDVMSLVRTGLTGITPEQGDILEEYLRRWNPYGGRFTAVDWSRPLHGWQPCEEDNTLLQGLNQTRKFIVAGVQAAHGGKAGTDCAKRLYKSLEMLGTVHAIEDRGRRLLELNDLQAASQTVQMWDIFCDSLEQCAGILGDAPINTEAFCDLLLVILNAGEVGTIPPSLDRVHIGDIRRFARLPSRAVFIAGAGIDQLPIASASKSLLGIEERSALESLDECRCLPPDSADLLDREMYAIYTAANLPKERLILSYAASGQDDAPCDFSRFISQPLPKPQPILHNEYTAESNMNKINGQNCKGSGKLFGPVLRLSASKLETWASCPFKFFCRHAMRLKERPAYGILPLDIGTALHGILENTVREIVNRGGTSKVSCQEIQDYALAQAETCISIGFAQGETIRLQKQAGRLCRGAVRMAADIWQELAVSDFVPIAFEAPLPYVKREIPGAPPGGPAEYGISGKADRLDAYQKNGQTYFRVIDYKSGKKKLSLSDMYYGKSLQLPLYLFSFCQNPPQSTGIEKAEPAGVLYVPVRIPTLSTDTPLSPETALVSERKELARNGLLLNDADIVSAMDRQPDPKMKFLSIQMTKEGRPKKNSLVATSEQLLLLEKHIHSKMEALAHSAAMGEFPARPLRKRDELECDFCSYRAACHFDPSEDETVSMKSFGSPDKFFPALGKADMGLK